MLRNTAFRWGSVAQALHWTIAALVLAQFALGLIATALPLGMEKLVVLARHKSVGITILALAIARLLWRAFNPAPPLPATMTARERRLASISHALMYVTLFAMPLTGWMMSSARNFPVSWFNVVQLPDLIAPNKTAYEFLSTSHEWLAITMGIFTLLHVAAALKHHFIAKDDVLRRMLPSLKNP